MKKIIYSLLLFLVVIICLLILYLKKDFPKTDPTIYYNGSIITLNENKPFAEAMFIEHGKIIKIGKLSELSAYDKQTVKKIDLEGKTVLPGFIDVHTHFALSMFLAGMHDLSGFKHESDKSVWQFFKEKVANSSPNDWIVCKGIDPILVKDLQTPTIQFLDSLAPENPVVIFSQSLHSYWANTKAFKMAGVTSDTNNPSSHSYYDKDENGNFTGLIVEQEAFKPFIEIVTNEVLTAKFLGNMSVQVMNDYAKNGNTTIVSTGLTINDSKSFILTKHLSDEKPSLLGELLAKTGQLPKREPIPRHFIYVRHDMANFIPQKIVNNDFYGIIGIKHWYDGSPYIGSMYMNESYLESNMTVNQLDINKGSKGKALISPSDLKYFIKKYHESGWQIAIHTQGDAAIQEVTDAYKDLESELDFSNSRHRLEHCLMLQSSQLEDIKRLNLTPSFHVNHLYYYGEALNTEILGEERTSKILPVNSALQKGIVSTLHADQPMFESKPFRLIQTAVERKTKENKLVIGEEEKITLKDAIKAVTINAAWQINMEDKLGSLEEGKYADFIVVDRDPFTIPTNELHSIKCLRTYINGNLVKIKNVEDNL